MVKSLDSRGKELLFSLSGFGPNFLMVLMGAYYTDAINPAALGSGNTFQAIMSGTCFILPAIFPILYAIGKAFDGIIDIPFAHITDTLSTKWGRRRPPIAVCLVPMIISYALCWIPIGGPEGQLLNTIWVFIWSLVFFATYTMCLISFYGSLSTTCTSESQRLRVSGYKSFFDTISYCLVYALVPLLLDAMKMHIDKFALMGLPLMLTMIIPLFLIKEGEKYGYPENEGMIEEKISIWQSLKLTFSNKLFMSWTFVNCCTYFGLQMFLVGMNAMIVGGMGMNGLQMAILNTCAFAPVPIMLFLFNKLKAKKGVRFTYQTCLIAFAIAILSFFFGSRYIIGPGKKGLQMLIGCIGGVSGSWAIGSFFMMPYLVPSQISSVEEKLTGRNHSAMYFAANAVTTSIIGAISGSLVYENIKMLFISKGASGVVYATNAAEAATKFGLDASNVFNLGTLLVPFIVCFVCILGVLLAFRMPKDFSPELVAKELKKMDPSLDISNIPVDTDENGKGEFLPVMVGLSVLSGFIFGFIWTAYLFKSVREQANTFKAKLGWLLGCLIPFGGLFVTLRAFDTLKAEADKKGIKMSGNKALLAISCIILPILPVNMIALCILQKNVNKLLEA